MIDIQNHIASNPGIMLGKPVIKGTRITVESILRKLADGYNPQKLIEMYPHLKVEDVFACIAYAAAVIENEDVIKAA